MKYIAILVLCIWYQYAEAQILPPGDDHDFLENIFVNQTGYINNEEYSCVLVYRGKSPGQGDKIYLQQKGNDSLVSINIPDEILDVHLTLVNSGPSFFKLITQEKEPREYLYYFYGNRCCHLTTFAKKKIRGHDGENSLD